MMRILIGSLFLIGVLLIAIPTPSTSGQTSIIVSNADTIRTMTTSAPLVNPSIQARVAVQYGNTIRHVNLASLPAPFQTLIAAVSAKITFHYANSNRQFSLVYPITIVNDTIPPSIGAITNSGGEASTTITWSTDEFTRYMLQYGTQPGNYTETVEYPLYAKQHTATLTGLVSGGTYYLQVTSIDRSGNQSVSPEFKFTVAPPGSNLFLPLVRR